MQGWCYASSLHVGLQCHKTGPQHTSKSDKDIKKKLNYKAIKSYYEFKTNLLAVA